MSGNLGQIIAGAIGPFGGVKPPKAYRAIGTIIANITESERHVDQLVITDHPVQTGAIITDHAFKRPAEVTLRVGWSESATTQNQMISTAGAVSGALASALGNAAAGTIQAQLSSLGAKAIGGSAIGDLAVANLSDIFGNSIVAVGTAFNTATGKGTSKMTDIYDQLQTLQASCIPFDVYTGKRKYESMLIQTLTVETDIKTEFALAAILVCRQVILVNVTVTAVNSDPSVQTNAPVTAAPVQKGAVQAVAVQPEPGSLLQQAIASFVNPFSALFTTGAGIIQSITLPHP